MSQIKCIDDFERYLRNEKNRSGHTVTAYIRDVRELCAFLTRRDTVRSKSAENESAGHNGAESIMFAATGESADIRFDDMTTSDIRSWVAHISRKGEKATTVRRKTQSVRAFFHYLCRVGLRNDNPAADIILAKLPRPLPHFVREEQMENLMAGDPAPDRAAERDGRKKNDADGSATRRALDHLVIHLLYATGIRAAEALTLTDTDIDFRRREMRVFGKGRKERVIPLADELLNEIRGWQKLRDDEWPGLPQPRHLLTVGHDGMSYFTLKKIVERMLAGTSADRKSPHTLRHTFATAMLNGGADLDSVRELLGHTSVATTQIYTHLTTADLKKTYDAAHPRAKREDKKPTHEN